MSFDIKHDVSGGVDPIVLAGACNGSTFFASKLDNYYIADPVGAQGDFTVVFFLPNTA